MRARLELLLEGILELHRGPVPGQILSVRRDEVQVRERAELVVVPLPRPAVRDAEANGREVAAADLETR